MFEKIWMAVATQIRLVETAIYQAMAGTGAIAITQGVVTMIFWVYVAWKIYEIWIAQADDTFTRRLWFIFKEYRRVMVVYLLVITAPVLVESLGAVARGFARQGRAKVEAPIPDVMRQIDDVMKTSTTLMSGVGTMLAVHAGGQDVASLTTVQGVKAVIKGSFNSGGGPTTTGVLATGVGSFVEAAKTYRSNFDSANAGLGKASDGTGRLARLGTENLNAQIAMAQKRGDTKLVTDLQALQKRNADAVSQAQMYGQATMQGPAAVRRLEMNELFMEIQNQWMSDFKTAQLPDPSTGKPAIGTAGGQMWKAFDAAGGWSNPQAASTLQGQIQQAVNSEMAARDQARGWQKDIPRFGFEIIGIIGVLICAIGAIAAGINIFKAAYGALLYCVGFVATVVFAVSLAKPLAPAFMLCFITDKTEPYGRNFVNFMLGGVFASMGMAMMAGAVSSLFKLTAQTIISEGAYRLAMVQVNTGSIGDFLLACLTMAGAMMVAGMAFTFIADFIKKGAAVGAGIFTGHYPA